MNFQTEAMLLRRTGPKIPPNSYVRLVKIIQKNGYFTLLCLQVVLQATESWSVLSFTGLHSYITLSFFTKRGKMRYHLIKPIDRSFEL